MLVALVVVRNERSLSEPARFVTTGQQKRASIGSARRLVTIGAHDLDLREMLWREIRNTWRAMTRFSVCCAAQRTYFNRSDSNENEH
jgi:hypothetical protein